MISTTALIIACVLGGFSLILVGICIWVVCKVWSTIKEVGNYGAINS
jgi:hypothetical protein